MTPEQIIKLAKESGFIPISPGMWTNVDLVRFANAIQAKERERCAELAARDRKIGDIGTSCGEYVECSGRPDAPHGVDLEASFRTGRTVCVCKSWAPVEAS